MSIESRIDNIELKIKKMEIENNLDIKMNMYKDISNEIDNLFESYNALKSHFKLINSIENTDIIKTFDIDENTYLKYLEEIDKFVSNYDENIEDQIKMYNIIVYKNIVCRQYLERRKREIIYVD